MIMESLLYLVTGASSGIGFQIASDLLEQGHRVIGVSRSPSSKIEKLINLYPDRFFYDSLDLTQDINGLPKWVMELSKNFGRFSGFVHSAGMQQILPLKMNSYAHMLQVFNLNLFAALALARGVSDKRVMSENGGAIVFLSSISAKIGQSGLVTYSASKAALNGAMRSMAKELSQRKIRVNSVLPGFVMTEMIDKWKDVYNSHYIEKMKQSCPLGIGDPKDVSNMVVYLLGERARWVTGCEFNINGGMTLGSQE